MTRHRAYFLGLSFLLAQFLLNGPLHAQLKTIDAKQVLSSEYMRVNGIEPDKESGREINIDEALKILSQERIDFGRITEKLVSFYCVLDKEGNATGWSLRDSSSTAYLEYAAKALNALRFKPLTVNGIPYSYETYVTMPFSKNLEECLNKEDHCSREPQPLNMDEFRSRIRYPQKLRRKGIQGKVVLRVLIDKQGNYIRHMVFQNPHPQLTETVTKQVAMLRFAPCLLYGFPIKVWVNLPVDFKLK
jgi:TonB family protein